MSKHPLKRRKRKLKKFRINVVSLVDRPMQTPSGIAILKRAVHNDDLMKRLLSPSTGETRKDFIARFMSDSKVKSEFPDRTQRLAVAGRKFGKRRALTTMTAGHSHAILTDREGGEVGIGTTSFVEGHAHDWLMDDAGNIIVADSEGHSHGIAVLVMKGGDEVLDNILPEGDTPADLSAEGSTAGEDNAMTAEDQAAKDAVTKAENDELKKRAERADSIVALPADQRAHFDTLEDSDKDTFLSKSADERVTVLAKEAEADKIVYTRPDGTEFRKSDDPRTVQMAKEADEDRKTLAAERKLTKRANFEKRAGEELAHLSGDLGPKADLLEAISSLPEDKREPALAVLKAQDAGIAAAMKRMGTQGHDTDGDTPDDQLEALAKKIQKDQKVETFAKAYEMVLATPEGEALYNQR